MMKIKVARLSDLRQYRSFLFPGVVVILIAVSAVTILKPRVSELLKLRRNLAKQEEELSQSSKKIVVLEGYDQNELQVRTTQALKVLPTEKDGPLILATVRNLVSESNLELVSLDIEIGEVSNESGGSKSKQEPLPPLGIRLSVAGSLGDLYDFLERIESAAPVIKINEVDIEREGTSIEGKIQLSTYYLAEPKDIGKASRQISPITIEEEKIYQAITNYQAVSTRTTLPLVSSGKEDLFSY